MFGSIPEGRNDEHSDLDVMIFGDISADVMREIVREAAAASTSEHVPIDLLFERDFPELSKAI